MGGVSGLAPGGVNNKALSLVGLLTDRSLLEVGDFPFSSTSSSLSAAGGGVSDMGKKNTKPLP